MVLRVKASPIKAMANGDSGEWLQRRQRVENEVRWRWSCGWSMEHGERKKGLGAFIVNYQSKE